MDVLSWGGAVTPYFVERVIQICRRYNWTAEHASWLMACMAFESGESFSPSVRNVAGSGATGLIQFMPATARAMGTSTDELSRMDAIEQLDYVEQYFAPYARRIRSLSDMYMAILLPKYVGQPNDSVLFSGGIAYRQNAGLDTDRDGVVTKEEATQKVYAKLVKGEGERYSAPMPDYL